MHESIISVLKGTSKVDTFCTKIEVPYEGFSLTVDPVGSVQFPITARTAKSIIVEAELAKFGKRTDTILDRSVRDVWEIPKNRIKVNKRWDKKLDVVLEQVQENLQLPSDGKLTAELHNLLIYMPGQFFKGHQDSEKTEGMLGTLVILLPSEFSGGTLVIDQHGDKKTFTAPSDTKKNLTIIAFYSDCHHEVKKVTAGYRVALTYNLIFAPSPRRLPLQANEKLEKELKAYFSAVDVGGERSNQVMHPLWFIYLLDHEYSRKSLGWQALRGTDRRRVAELLGCADNLGLQAHLTLADIHETWSAEGDDSFGRYRRYGRGRYFEEQDNEELEVGGESSHSEEYQLIEIIDDEIELRHWVDHSGRELEREGHIVPDDMVCWTKAVDKFRPFRTQYEGYMGNYGNTLDRWYHRAAIVLWKKESEFTSLLAIDSNEVLKKIGDLLKKNLETGRGAILQIMPQWTTLGGSGLDASQVFEVAALIQDPDLASGLVQVLGIKSVSEKTNPDFLNLLDAYGEKWCLDQLELWKKNQEWNDVDGMFKDLIPVARDLSRKSRRVSSWILKYWFSQVVNEDRKEEKLSSSLEVKRRLKGRMKMVDTLCKAAVAAGDPEIHRSLIENVLNYPRLYPAVQLTQFLLPSLDFSRHNSSEEWGYAELLAQLRNRLESELSSPRRKGDWSIRDTLPHDCPDCKYLKDFLSSGIEQNLVWPLRKDRRMHIHDIIEGMDIPVTHVTHRVGSPQKLVLTKTSTLFDRDEARMKAVAESLAKLRKVMTS